MRHFRSHKSNNFEAIALVENDMVISDGQKIVDIFSEYFDTNYSTKIRLRNSKGCHIY